MADSKPELFFGLVGAVGTDLNQVVTALMDSLNSADYSLQPIRLSERLTAIERYQNLPTQFGDDYIFSRMEAGNEFRRELKLDDAVSLLGVASVRDLRRVNGDNPLPNTAFVFRSLKNPEEVSSLRRIYGASFYLIAAYAPLEDRKIALAKRIAESRKEFPFDRFIPRADELMAKDQEDIGDSSGQHTRDTFHRADLFVDISDTENLRKSVARFVELIFGYPFHTPTRAEYSMFHAHAASLRSAELGRQVGASIATKEGDIIAVGCNEVPKANGGLYWYQDKPDKREFHNEYDESDRQKKNLIAQTLKFLMDAGWLTPDKKDSGLEKLLELAISSENPVFPKDSKIRSLIEFGRAVHAEMAALTDAARRGVAVEGQMMYVTAFPCHLCARHIVAAGIKSVIYIEPYAKSLAAELYPDSINVEDGKDVERVPFQPFVGVAPRQYINLFTPRRRKDPSGKPVRFNMKTALAKFSENPQVYLDNEVTELKKLSQNMNERGFGGQGGA
jgi:deoxycytidylate deaminase